MPNVDPSIPRRPEFADTQPDLRILARPAARAARTTALARIQNNALPLLVGAGVGVGLTVAVAALTTNKEPRFSLFSAPRATPFGSLARIALIAIGRAAVRHVLARAVERAAAIAAA